MTTTIIEHRSPNHSERRACVRVDTILLHHTAGHSDAGDLAELCNPSPFLRDGKTPRPRVSAHYLVGTEGAVYRLVPEAMKAWHAGLGRLPWETCPEYDFNHRSIGIEVVNPGDGKTPFTEAQYLALAWLVPDIVWRLSWGSWKCSAGGGKAWTDAAPYIPAHGGLSGYILGHRDIAPGRKTDPADNFDWARIREALSSARVA